MPPRQEKKDLRSGGALGEGAVHYAESCLRSVPARQFFEKRLKKSERPELPIKKAVPEMLYRVNNQIVTGRAFADGILPYNAIPISRPQTLLITEENIRPKETFPASHTSLKNKLSDFLQPLIDRFSPYSSPEIYLR